MNHRLPHCSAGGHRRAIVMRTMCKVARGERAGCCPTFRTFSSPNRDRRADDAYLTEKYCQSAAIWFTGALDGQYPQKLSFTPREDERPIPVRGRYEPRFLGKTGALCFASKRYATVPFFGFVDFRTYRRLMESGRDCRFYCAR
jgi:hypothetical protein